MDGEFWTARMSTSKRHHTLQPSQSLIDRHLNLDDVDGDEDLRAEFSCPFCYEEFDTTALCPHLEEEHCFESRPAMCPVCAVKVPKDMVGHISLQHGHLFKMQRRRRFRRAGVPSNATLSLLGKELREAHLQALLGGTSRSSGLSSATDPLLSSMVYNVPISETEDPPKPTVVVEEQPAKLSSLSQQSKASAESSLTAEELEEKRKHANMRAKFVQQLVLSTLLGDD
ncbi:protein DEHYDRATION-INDUCED 19 [Physcomitrium patens]|uniref:Drought induced 19 protein type zinc-binding domain-containing protein n=1 Tax=Physcomitrium patens TaxID=3218 RepID=A9SS49_PHYPA|nr:protein DEHYDRATION-INDUCED 19-like [Physcomitrium patens]PNR63512.1 hypothetical protein PHYPA_001938 [Physcomitrium patens]|eukprot:XP_024389433.1 protein DEHYDRATION-INDUCED 19-like [Physcomitrella patens]